MLLVFVVRTSASDCPEVLQAITCTGTDNEN